MFFIYCKEASEMEDNSYERDYSLFGISENMKNVFAEFETEFSCLTGKDGVITLDTTAVRDAN